ncbi:MAG: hypothetical protein AUI50_01280 [Crenarchaeota archaeon 13_1_40CM_2_52_14]|nr:MAG: hypothetical protein AUI50_01280 [Crenarchaeota archaeon 13_1_40CM_2_52_14]
MPLVFTGHEHNMDKIAILPPKLESSVVCRSLSFANETKTANPWMEIQSRSRNPALGANGPKGVAQHFFNSASESGPKNRILKPSFETNVLTRFSKLDPETGSCNSFLNQPLKTVAVNFPGPPGAYSSRTPRHSQRIQGGPAG